MFAEELDDIITKCNQRRKLNDSDIKEICMKLAQSVQKVLPHGNETVLKHIKNSTDNESLNEKIESLSVELEEINSKINIMYNEMRKTNAKEIERVKIDMKHIISQFEVEMNVLDEFCYLTTFRFERQINEEFKKIYKILELKIPIVGSQTYHLPFKDLKATEYLERDFQRSKRKVKEAKKKKEPKGEEKVNDTSTTSIGRRKTSKSVLKREKKLALLHQESKSRYTCSKSWIHPHCTHLSNVVIEENQITAANGCSNVFLFGSTPLSKNFVFQARFEAISYCVSLGIGDIQYANLLKIDEQSPNIIEYTNDSYLYCDGNYIKKQGKGFKVGETVTISGNFNEGIINFSVNEEIRCFFESDKLKTSAIQWVPYIVFEHGDSVSIFGFN